MKLSILALLLVGLVACAAPVEPEPVPNEVPQEPQEQAEPEPQPEPEPAPEPEETMAQNEEAVEELMDEAAEMDNYRFDYATVQDSRVQGRYYLDGDNVKVALATGTTRAQGSYDTVYLNRETQEARAYCQQGSASVCPDPEELIAEPEYDEYMIEFPHETFQRLEGGVMGSSITLNSASSTLVEGWIDDRYAELTVHDYHSVPMRIRYYDDESKMGAATGISLSEFSFLNVRDIEPPGGW